MPPVDVVDVQLNPSTIFPVKVIFVGLVVLIILHDPEAPVRLIEETVLLSTVAFVGDPVSIITWVPVPAKSNPEIILLLILTVAAVAELLIPVHIPVVANVFAPIIVFPEIEIVFEEAVDPIPLSIAVVSEVVAPDFTVTVLFSIVALALVPA